MMFSLGERAPGWEGGARATISGITRHTTSAHLLRAGMEAVALRLAAVAKLMGGRNSKIFQNEDVIALLLYSACC